VRWSLRGIRTMVTFEEALGIKDSFSESHLGRFGVCGVGVGQDDTGAPILVVHVDPDATSPEGDGAIPDQIGDLPVRIEQTGPFRAQAPRS
jgi:hypothetical protein